MKLTNLRRVGRFRNKKTAQEVNIHKGQQAGRCTDVYYYLYRNSRQIISAHDFHQHWERIA